MDRRHLLLATAVLAVCLGTAGCTSAQGEDITSRPHRAATGAADEVALTIATISAWPNLHVDGAPSVPDLVVYGDGHFYGTVYDGEDWVLRTGTLPAEDLDDLLVEAADLPSQGYGEPGFDGSTTTIALGPGSGEGRPREVSVWVPSEIDSYDGTARENRVAFNEVLEDSHDLALSAGDPWTPQDWFLLSDVETPYPGSPDPAPWPVAGLDPTGADADGLDCQVLSEQDAERVRAAQADEDTDVHGWTHDGAVVDVLLLPVIPGVDCADLSPYRYPVG